jgi:hypothetical protein
VLRKLGFRATGRVEPVWSQGRGGEAACARFELSLDSDDCKPHREPRMAA